MYKNKCFVYSFYRFIEVKNKEKIKNILDSYLSTKKIRGTILLADEGINASISGQEEILNDVLKLLRKLLNIRKINFKSNETEFLPFNRIKVRLKKEIVTLGKGKIDVHKYKGKFIEPHEWNDVLNNKNMNVIDVRNIFEIDIGKFKNSINPKTNSFRDFPKYIQEFNLPKNSHIAMYCTGGIRCEKASSYMKMKGYKNIFQLKGGIINYLDYIKKNKLKSCWKGECFVFDDRVTIDDNLSKGNYLQCYGCRRPITIKDTFSSEYKKGVSCPYCYYERTKTQKKNSESRQKQIEKANESKINHPFSKIK